MKKGKVFRAYQMILFIAVLFFLIPETNSFADTSTLSYDLQSIPMFDEYIWVTLDKNHPIFSEEVLTTTPYIQLSPLDELGRPGTVIVCLGPETILNDYDYMPARDTYRPSGWQEVNEPVFSRPLYSCARLIAPCLYPDLDVAENYFTATEEMSGLEFFPFANGLYKYIKETGNHVILRVTPFFEGDNLLCSGVLIEEWSVEEPPEKYSSTRQRAFLYNAEQTMIIDYSTGEAWQKKKKSGPRGLNSALFQRPDGENNQSETGTIAPQINYVLNTNTMKFHYPRCDSVNDIKPSNRFDYSGTRDDVVSMGYSPCGRCKP